MFLRIRSAFVLSSRLSITARSSFEALSYETIERTQALLVRVYLQFENEIVVLLVQRGDVVQDNGNDDVDAVGLVIDDGVLIVAARTLAVLRQCVQRLIDELDVVLVDVVAQQAEQTGLGAADGVEKFQRFTDEVVVGFVIILQTEVVLSERE